MLKVEHGYENQSALNLTKGDIVAFTEEVVRSFIDYADEKDISIHLKTSESNCFCTYDAVKFEHILFNLISNAIKYSERMESVDIDLVLDKDNNQISVEVQDGGHGIAEDELGKIFGRYYKGENAQKGKVNSSGIGLDFSMRLAHVMGGNISVESELDMGSVFTLTIPVKMEDFEVSNLDDLQLTHDGVMVEFSNKPKLLLVEDNWHLRNYLFEELHIDYDVIAVENGQVLISDSDSRDGT